jgi:ABC-type glycerol-3-phosphate transport system substrate-binding protein
VGPTAFWAVSGRFGRGTGRPSHLVATDAGDAPHAAWAERITPGLRTRRPPVIGGGSGLTIIAGIPAEKREAGWEFAKFVTSTPNTVSFSQQTGYMVVRTDAASLPAYQQYLAQNPNAKVTFDQMQYVRIQDSIVEVPRAPPAIEAAMWQLLGEDRPARQTFEDMRRQLALLAQRVKR